MLESFSKFTIFRVSIIFMIVTEFCQKLKVVSSDFPMMKNIVVPWPWFSSFPIKLICCGSFDLGCLLKSIVTDL